MARLKIPTGILPSFRFFLIFRLLWAGMILMSNQAHTRDFPFVNSSLVSIGESCFLLVYLSLPWLQNRLGKLHLPLGLFIATVGPSIETALMFFSFPQMIVAIPASVIEKVPEISQILIQVLVFSSELQLLFMLFIPMILTSWQYSLRWTLAYSLGTALLDTTILWLIYRPFSLPTFAPQGVIIIRSILFLVAGFVINRLSSEQKEQNRQLSHYAATLEQLATSRERNRLAREIHDTLAHTLSGLAVNLEAISALWSSQPERAHEILEQSLSVTRNGLVETRRAIQALRAGPLDDLGFILALRQLALSSAERYNLQAEIRLPPALNDSAPAIEQGIYRIAEEGLRNIGQHAQASRFRMELSQQGQHIQFTLEDDGQGFKNSQAAQDQHFGLLGMQERAQALGGSLKISSRPQKGTTLIFDLEENPK